jgi:hypothetical protein
MTVVPSGPRFAIQDIPFSYRGSWFNISPVVAQKMYADDLHLVSHQSGLHAVLRLTPSGEGAVVVATPALLTWQHEAGRIELAYENPDTVRVRGDGLGLRIAAAAPPLTPFSGTYLYRDPVDGSHVFTSYETGRRYRVTVRHGEPDGSGGVQALGAADRHVTMPSVRPWEIAIEEYETARRPYASTARFDDLARAAAAAFTAFTDAVAPWRGAETPAAELAAYVLWSATVAPGGFLGRPAVLMSKHWMDKVWSWDHCFNAIALASGEPELAWHQFQLPFDHQDRTGALPDSISHSEILYNYVKPPVHGWALRQVRQHLRTPLDRADLATTYDRLARWTDFWLAARRVPGHELPHYQHGNDSGWDNATTFDEHRVIETADLAAFLIIQLRQGQLRTGTSLLDLMPIVLGADLPASVSTALARDIERHLTAHGLATEPVDSQHYRADGYWRGPIWAPSTVLVEDGLRRAGHTDLADEISHRFRALCEKSGFAENFDAETGTGLRDRAYTWTASSYLILAAAHQRRRSRL